MLPKSDGAKEKVLREVKALAKLDHTGIVRYFNAWVESPPTGWQEERDEQFHFSDTSGPTSHTETASHIGGYHSEQSQFVPSAETREERNRNNKDVQDKCPLTPVTRMGSEIATDSITFSSQNTPCVQMSKQSGSGNFSVHSSLSETFDRCENGFAIPRDSFFSFGVNANTMDVTSDSITDSKSSIPFSNYSFSSSALISHPADQSDQELSGDSVVFESTNNRPTCNNAVYEQTTSFCNSDVVFEKSSVSEGKQMNENGHCYCQNDQEHHMVDFSLSLHKNDSKGERAENKSSAQVVLCGNKFFLYIQMQLYRKETLKDWLNSNTLNRDRHTVLDIFDQILCAVDYVHSQGLMHRDLKPSNIFFTADEVVKVGDFGLVTALSVQQDQESDSGLKSPGKHTAEVGTTLYMSPEQIARRPYDLKIDIFSLGLIFLELLIPFSTQMERIRTLQDAKKQIFPLRFNRELPLESELVHKMTNSDPNLRPFTMDILDHPLLLEFAPTRMGTGHRKRTISNKSIS